MLQAAAASAVICAMLLVCFIDWQWPHCWKLFTHITIRLLQPAFAWQYGCGVQHVIALAVMLRALVRCSNDGRFMAVKAAGLTWSGSLGTSSI
jgi:hypothetical protein